MMNENYWMEEQGNLTRKVNREHSLQSYEKFNFPFLSHVIFITNEEEKMKNLLTSLPFNVQLMAKERLQRVLKHRAINLDCLVNVPSILIINLSFFWKKTRAENRELKFLSYWIRSTSSALSREHIIICSALQITVIGNFGIKLWLKKINL